MRAASGLWEQTHLIGAVVGGSKGEKKGWGWIRTSDIDTAATVLTSELRHPHGGISAQLRKEGFTTNVVKEKGHQLATT